MSDANDLSHDQMLTLVLSMHVRNAMEHLHHRIDNALMAELNVVIRYAIFDFFETMMPSQRNLEWLARMVPPCWGIPGRDPRPTFTGEPLWEAKPYPQRPGSEGLWAFGGKARSVGSNDMAAS